jgi:hypothetical protein
MFVHGFPISHVNFAVAMHVDYKFIKVLNLLVLPLMFLISSISIPV